MGAYLLSYKIREIDLAEVQVGTTLAGTGCSVSFASLPLSRSSDDLLLGLAAAASLSFAPSRVLSVCMHRGRATREKYAVQVGVRAYVMFG